MRRNQIVELVACHLNMGQSSTDSETEGTSGVTNFYDPDREFMKQALAEEMYGKGAGYGKAPEYENQTPAWMPKRRGTMGYDPVKGQPEEPAITFDPRTGKYYDYYTGKEVPPPTNNYGTQPVTSPTGPPKTATTQQATYSGGSGSVAGIGRTYTGPDGKQYYSNGEPVPTGTTQATTSAATPAASPTGLPSRGATQTLGPRGGLTPTAATPPAAQSQQATTTDRGRVAPTGAPVRSSTYTPPTGRTGGPAPIGFRSPVGPSIAPPTGDGGRMPITLPTGGSRVPITLGFRSGFDTPVPIGTGGGGDVNPNFDSGEWGEGGASGNRGLASGQLYDAYGNLMNSQGYSEQEKNAITQEGMNAARATYAGEGGLIARRAAATGNTAGYAAGVSALGRSEAGTYGQQARQNIIDFAKEKQRRRELGLQGMGGLYTGETNYLSGLMGQRASLVASPTGKLSTTQGKGNYMGTNFGLSVT